MYRVDRRIHRHKRTRRNLIIIGSILVTAGIVYGLFHVRVAPKQQLHNSPSVSTKFASNETKKITISKPLFTMELPATWKETTRGDSSVPLPTYTFVSPDTDKQVLYIYLDNIPEVALNRAIIVSSQGYGLAYETVSENCATFTDSATKDLRTGYAPARWQGANFLCDMGNAQRAYVGTISKDQGENITVTGQVSGQHKMFIMYVDNNINPNYSVFYGILGSMHFK